MEVIDSVDKPKNDAKLLLAYSQEIAPKIRELLKKKELLKDFKDSDETALELADAVKSAQAALKDYIEKSDDGKEIIDEIHAIEKEVKEAIKGAAKASTFKPAQLKAFLLARAKEDAVKKVIDKGSIFTELTLILKEV